jgi:hypothetical protein
MIAEEKLFEAQVGYVRLPTARIGTFERFVFWLYKRKITTDGSATACAEFYDLWSVANRREVSLLMIVV